MQPKGCIFLFIAAPASAFRSRTFVPQPPAVKKAAQPVRVPQLSPVPELPPVQMPPVAQPVDQPVYVEVQPPQYTPPRTGLGMFYGVGAVVVSLAVGGAMGSHWARRQKMVEAEEFNSLAQLQMMEQRQALFEESNSVLYSAAQLLESRQQLVEAEEADSLAQLRMIEQRQALYERQQTAFSLVASPNFAEEGSVLYASDAQKALVERRQMLIEQDEASSLQELQFLSEKQRLEETREMLFNFDAQIHAVQESVEEVVKQTLTAGEEYARKLPGAVPLLGYFDPLGILSDSTEERVQYYRDAELKHGRIGTLAAIGIIVSEAYHPFGGDELNGVPAIFAFQHNMILQTAMVASVAALAARPQLVPDTERKQTTEIWHVRGGMLAAFGMIADEALTNHCLVCL
jgi:hypothetical protein